MNISKINSVSYVTRNNIGYNVGNDNNRVENNNENNLNKNISFGTSRNYKKALKELRNYKGTIDDYLHNVVGKYAELGGLTNEEINDLYSIAVRYIKPQCSSSEQPLTFFQKIRNFFGL